MMFILWAYLFPRIPGTSPKKSAVATEGRSSLLNLFRNPHHPNDDQESLASILIIEDTEADRVLIQRSLEKGNYSVIAAPDGETGLKCADEHDIYLIILDYLLPGKNGLETCKILKGDPRTKDIPVIFLTVMDGGGVILDCYGAGAEAYIHKPIDTRHLLREVEFVLSEARKNQREDDGS